LGLPSPKFSPRGIEQEIVQVEQKTQRNTAERFAEAMEDADEVLECYQRIQRLLERLAVRLQFGTLTHN
jgi:hypothetical protein